MSPLARLIREKNRAGMSFRKMEHNALAAGYNDYSAEAFRQLANDERKGPLNPAVAPAVAAGIGETAQRVLALDDERWRGKSNTPQMDEYLTKIAAVIARSSDPARTARVMLASGEATVDEAG